MDCKDLDHLIDEFGSMVPVATASFRYDRPDWKVLWAKATEIQNSFRGTRYPTRQERDHAWTRFSNLRNAASDKAESDRDERRSQSEYHRDSILRQVESARPTTLIVFGDPEVAEMKHLSQVLNEARTMLGRNKTEMPGEDKQECFTKIQEMQVTHDAWWSHLKQLRSSEREEAIRTNSKKNYERYRNASEALEHYRSRVDELRAKIASAFDYRVLAQHRV
jgi:hypothetical protein